MKSTTNVTTPTGCSENSTTTKSQQPGRGRGLGLDEASWTFRFKHEGKRYTLIKRNKSRDGVWWLQTVIARRRIVKSLATNIAAAASDLAIRNYIRPAREGRWEQVKPAKLREDVASLGKVFACYQEMSVGKLPDSTVRANLNSFRLVVRRGLGNDSMSNESVDAQASSVLTGKLVADFEEWMGRKAAKEKRDIEANKRSVDGYVRQSRSLFKRTALPRYGEKGVKLPDLEGFMSRAVEPGAKVVKIAPADNLLAVTFGRVKDFQEADPEAFMAWLLCLCSLRRREASLARFDWLVRTAGQSALVVPPEVAKSDAARIIPIDEWVAMQIGAWQVKRQTGLDVEEERFILRSPRMGQGGPDCRLRAQNTFKRASKWMRDCGWTTKKTLHEMRALYLMWVRDNYGLDTAQAVAGHSDQRTTQRNYTGMKAVKGVTITLPLALTAARE